ncbi:hypothetical protein C1752_02027 [Acaryochloris thomasi RCC1774]|uniref:Uncharacterized protein n=1 Tax=Acaryochloris thomasi RCC1774 TaxID=1764569 RepID=A0A2W1JS33_9CYAN|nr:hypothetical protein [Acaryochloris thomasi]PZD73502.1 hypothetical protein C1752_02027 [Acaryochloris thomasi RCC1774]
MRQPPIDPAFTDHWFSAQQQQAVVEKLRKRVGLTRIRAQYFVQLWVYLLVQQKRQENPKLQPPLSQLDCPVGPISCTHREAANLFYSNKEQGSDRAAGLILDKLAALGLLKKTFDGNTTQIAIPEIPEMLGGSDSKPVVKLLLDDFDPRCDAIPIANLLATNYSWMNQSLQSTPHRIAQLLRLWAGQYGTGMRVLRRSDNLNPMGFYLLYPVASESEVNFFEVAHRGLHLSSLSDADPFVMATPGDETCVAVFIRSWMIEPAYLECYRAEFVADAQQTLLKMQKDFPNLCDLYTLMIHPSFEAMTAALGFQKLQQAPSSIYWVYLALDRFLSLDVSMQLAREEE